MPRRTRPPSVPIETVDLETLRRARDGDSLAFTRLVQVHEPGIRRVARALLPAEQVDDAVQDILLKVHLQLHRFDLDRSDRLKGWLMVLARNACRDQLRRPQRSTVAFDELVYDLEAAGPTPLDTLLQDEREQLVREQLDTLPSWYREAFQQRCLQGESYEDIARTNHITRAAVRTRVGRARQHLRVHLQESLQVA